jgi:hypothetical protein
LRPTGEKASQRFCATKTPLADYQKIKKLPPQTTGMLLPLGKFRID